VSNQLSNYGDVPARTHPAPRGRGRRSIRTQGRLSGLLRDEEVAGSNPVTPTNVTPTNQTRDSTLRTVTTVGHACLTDCRSGAGVRPEQPIHDHRAGLDHRSQLVPVDQLGDALTLCPTSCEPSGARRRPTARTGCMPSCASSRPSQSPAIRRRPTGPALRSCRQLMRRHYRDRPVRRWAGLLADAAAYDHIEDLMLTTGAPAGRRKPIRHHTCAALSSLGLMIKWPRCARPGGACPR
jgi:hypothetical protein